MPTNKTHQISLDEAIRLTKAYRANPVDELGTCQTFELTPVLDMLGKPEAAYLRIYFGRKEDNSIHTILVAADKDQKDILPDSANRSAGDGNDGDDGDDGDGDILEDSMICPPQCPPPSPLN